MIDYLEQMRDANPVVDLAFYAYRDMTRCDWRPFVKAAIERSPVSAEKTESMTAEQIHSWLTGLPGASIYDGTRLAQPDEAANYHTGDGGKRGAFEVEAESISHVLLRANGMQSSADGASRYVAGWATIQKDNPGVVRAAGETVAKAVKELIGSGSWRNLAV